MFVLCSEYNIYSLVLCVLCTSVCMVFIQNNLQTNMGDRNDKNQFEKENKNKEHIVVAVFLIK